MDVLRVLLDSQRFVGNCRLQALIDDTAARCCPAGEALADDDLELAAAGEPDAGQVSRDD